MSEARKIESEGELQTLQFVEDLKRQWMATVDSLVDPLMIVDTNYSIKKANNAFLKLTDQSDFAALIGRKCYKVFAHRDSPCPGCRMQESAQAGDHLEFALDRLLHDRYFEVHSQPIASKHGIVEGVVQTYHDRTDKKSMEEKLLQAEKLASIGLLAGGVAHEINNPLAGILVFSQMLLKEMDPKSPHYSDVKEIENAGQRCKEIVDNLLEFARQSPGTSHNHERQRRLRPISINECLDDAKRFLGMAMKGKISSVLIDDRIKASGSVAAVEKSKLVHVFLNLMQNAVQAMPKGGRLALRNRIKQTSGEVREWMEISFEDTGCGISEENLKKIFDPFFTTKDPGEGTGLGLALCYGIVKDLGGDITVQSVVGDGSVFTVRLPLSKVPA